MADSKYDGAMLRQIVLVSGTPGSGKSTLAAPLAKELGATLISKDDIKETLWDVLHAPSQDLAWSRTLGAAAMEVLWRLAAQCPFAVLDAPFRPQSTIEQDHIASLDARVIEVHCSCSPSEAIRRYNGRADQRHPTHVLRVLTPEHLAEFDGALHLGPRIDINTEGSTDIPHLAQRIRQLLRGV
jgi:predicted kinase